MSRTSSASDSQTHNRTARPRVRGTLARLPGWVREAGDGFVARFVTRRSLDWSPLRAGLHALAHITR